MKGAGISSNIMSLGGIAIAIGVLVDAGIVMTENVIRQAEQYEAEHGNYRDHIWEITLKAARLVGRPISFAMVIIILAFVPVFALTGMEGKMFHPLAFTKTFAMVCSTILAITLVPVLCTFLIRGKLHSEDENPMMRILRAIYRPVLAWALRHRAITLGAALAYLPAHSTPPRPSAQSSCRRSMKRPRSSCPSPTRASRSPRQPGFFVSRTKSFPPTRRSRWWLEKWDGPRPPPIPLR